MGKWPSLWLKSDEEIIFAVTSNNTLKAALEYLGCSTSGITYDILKKRIKSLNLDISHLKFANTLKGLSPGYAEASPKKVRKRYTSFCIECDATISATTRSGLCLSCSIINAAKKRARKNNK